MYMHEDGVQLMESILKGAPDGAKFTLVCLASLTDAAALFAANRKLCTSRVQEVVIMGGIESFDDSDNLVPDTSYNNNCDMESARQLYAMCASMCVPTLTLRDLQRTNAVCPRTRSTMHSSLLRI